MISRNAPIAQPRKNLSLCEFELAKLYEFFVTPDAILGSPECVGNDAWAAMHKKRKEIPVAPALVLAVFRTLCDFTRRNDWQRCTATNWAVHKSTCKETSLMGWEHRTWLTQEEMGARAMVCVSTVQRALKVLVTLGLVRIESHQINRMKTRNVTWVQFTDEQIAFVRDPAHRKASKANETIKTYEEKFAPARGHTVQEIEDDKLRREEIARQKFARKGHFIKSPCLTIGKPDFVRDVRPKLKRDFENTSEAEGAERMAVSIGVTSQMAKTYAIHNPTVLVELVLYAKQCLKIRQTWAGWTCKNFQRFVVGLPYGQAENDIRWTRAAQERTLREIKRGRRGQFAHDSKQITSDITDKLSKIGRAF